MSPTEHPRISGFDLPAWHSSQCRKAPIFLCVCRCPRPRPWCAGFAAASSRLQELSSARWSVLQMAQLHAGGRPTICTSWSCHTLSSLERRRSWPDAAVVSPLRHGGVGFQIPLLFGRFRNQYPRASASDTELRGPRQKPHDSRCAVEAHNLLRGRPTLACGRAPRSRSFGSRLPPEGAVVFPAAWLPLTGEGATPPAGPDSDNAGRWCHAGRRIANAIDIRIGIAIGNGRDADLAKRQMRRVQWPGKGCLQSGRGKSARPAEALSRTVQGSPAS